jgi:hypothetical protein
MRALAAALWLGTALAPAARGADPSSQMCPDESPLGGWIRMQHREQDRRTDQDGCDQVTNVFMTFDLVPSGPSIEVLRAQQAAAEARMAKARPLPPQFHEQMWNLRLAARVGQERDATKLKYWMWSDGCHDIGGSHYTCNVPGGSGFGEITLGESTPTGFILNAPLSVHGVIFDPMGPSLRIGTSSASGESLLHQEEVCVGKAGYGGSRGMTTLGGFSGLYVSILPEPVCNRGDNSARNFCVPPTACFQTTDATQRRECAIDPGKFAVLPFEGSLEKRFPTAGIGQAIVFSKMSWKVCCGCGQAPPPPDFPSEPCPDTAKEDADLATNRAKEAAATADLAILWKSYEDEMSKAQSHLRQFQTTMRSCKIQTALTDLLSGTLGLFSPAGEAEIAAEGVGESEAIKKAAETLGEQIGDPGSTLLTVISKLLNNEDPTAKTIPSEFLRTYQEAVEAAEKFITFVNGSSATQLEEQMKDCAGTIVLSDENWKGANEYIEDLKAAMANVPATQVLVNDIRQLDTELPDLQYRDYAACVRRARCLKQPESSCAKLKPAGDWPDVQ